MKQVADKFTSELFDKRPVGRPPKVDAKTPAQRAKEYRARKKQAKFDFLRNLK